jgi:DNA polymerase III subunit epsilon
VRLRRSRTGAAETFASAGRPAESTPWREAGWCALDLELTGLDPRRDHIIAIGAVPIDDGRIVLGQSLYTLVRSAKRSQHGAVLAHKLRVADLADAPDIDEALESVLELMTSRVPVFHSAFVERSFLGPLFSRRGAQLPPAADTESLGRLWLGRRDGTAPPSLPLTRLSQALGQIAEPPHHALGDALTTAQVFIALAGKFDQDEPQTVGSLLIDAGPQPGGGRRFGPG